MVAQRPSARLIKFIAVYFMRRSLHCWAEFSKIIERVLGQRGLPNYLYLNNGRYGYGPKGYARRNDGFNKG